MFEEIKKKIEEEKLNYRYLRNSTKNEYEWRRYDGMFDGLQKALDIIKEVLNDKNNQ